MAIIQTIKLKDRVKNDTSNSVEFIYNDGNEDPIDITSWSFRIQFRYFNKTGLVVLDVTDGSGITKTDAANGVFELDAFGLDWEIGKYYFDVQATFSGETKTYIQGYWDVIQDTTFT